MGSARNSNNTRKARIDEMRRQERSRERWSKSFKAAGIAVIVSSLSVAGFFLITSNKDDKKDDGKVKALRSTVDKNGIRSWDPKQLTRTHVTHSVTYSMNPPVGGDHNPVWLNCNGDVYDHEVPKENAVHALEHGAVWVTYTSKASQADVKKLEEKVKKTPYSLMSKDEDQKDPIMLSAWGKQRAVASAADPNVDKFFAEFVQGKQTPEPGAPCTGGVSK